MLKLLKHSHKRGKMPICNLPERAFAIVTEYADGGESGYSGEILHRPIGSNIVYSLCSGATWIVGTNSSNQLYCDVLDKGDELHFVVE